MGYYAATKAKVMSPEISTILEADVVYVAEGSIHTTVSQILRSWNIAESSGTWQDDVSPGGMRSYSVPEQSTCSTKLTHVGVATSHF